MGYWVRTTPKGYIWDNRIFFGAVAIMLLIVLYIGSVNGFRPSPYFECKAEHCYNPLMQQNDSLQQPNLGNYNIIHPVVTCNGFMCNFVKCEEDWCSQPIVSRGEYGKRPISNYMFFLGCLILFVIAFNINHFIYNKGKEVDLDFQNSPLGKILNKLPKDNKDENTNYQRK